VLPLDYSATARELAAALRTLEAQLGDRFDVSDCIGEADRLQAEVARFAKEAPPMVANRALMRLGRILIPVLYTQAGRFDHDPATSIPPLPPLVDASRLAGSDPTSDEAKTLHIATVRGRNRLLQALGDARRCISQ
jgi:N-acetylated-alpha-linked acidic dipeptidase